MSHVPWMSGPVRESEAVVKSWEMLKWKAIPCHAVAQSPVVASAQVVTQDSFTKILVVHFVPLGHTASTRTRRTPRAREASEASRMKLMAMPALPSAETLSK